MKKRRFDENILKQKPVQFVLDLLGISMGTVIAASGIVFFLIPFKAAPGGVTAISQVLYYSHNISLGLSMLIMNTILFIIGTFFLGKMFGLKTFFAICMMAALTNFFNSTSFRELSFVSPYLINLAENSFSFTQEKILGVLAGGMLLGGGLGMVFRFNGSCGSTDIPALILRKYFGLSIGTSYLLIDTVIIVIAGSVFKDFNLILLGVFALFITSRMADRVIKGPTLTRSVMIISDHTDKIRQVISSDINRGCTIFNAEGGYTKEPRKALYTICNMHELVRIKIFVKNIDPNAFIIVNSVSEVWGVGFKVIS